MSHIAYVIAGTVLALATAGCPSAPFAAAGKTTCPDPAPLLGERTEAPGYIVVFNEGTVASEVTAELARKYGFTPRHVYEHALHGFAAELSDAALAGIRCEPVVKHVEYEGIITVR